MNSVSSGWKALMQRARKNGGPAIWRATRDRRSRQNDRVRIERDLFAFAQTAGDRELRVVLARDLHLARDEPAILPDVDDGLAGRLRHRFARNHQALQRIRRYDI